MAVLDHNDTRCPRCGSPSIVLSATELRPGFEYLTLRCTSCHLVYDAQVPWPAPGSEETELRCLMEQEADHGEASQVCPRVQA
jgi:rubredoxin